jgi:uncharacterized membrane protein SpoIIM required for sporulation
LTESQFINKNKLDWEELEALLYKNNPDPDKLNRLFVKVSSDLSYARTFFPNRSVRLYLNNLTQSVFDTMRVKEDKFSLNQIINFFTHILPQEIYNSRRALLTSLTFFVLAVSIGVVSSINDENFPALILGDDYISMTEENIAKGDPMAVYKDDRKLDMFFGITTNNIRVSFLAFVLGFFGSVGTIVVLLHNGIMLGAFQYFFYSKGLFWTSFSTIWIHGTIEISAIIIAGGAGILVGNGLLFPKTYSRISSIQINSLRALRLILGAVPLFIMAGMLESYVTRHTGLPDIIKGGIIGLSFLLILLMWVIYPIYYNYKKRLTGLDYTIEPRPHEVVTIDKLSYRSLSQVIGDSFLEFRTYMGSNLIHATLPTLLILITMLWIFLKYIYTYSNQTETGSMFTYSNSNTLMVVTFAIILSYAMCMIIMSDQKIDMTLDNKFNFLKKYFPKIAATTLIYYIPIALIDSWYLLLVYVILSPQLYVILIDNIISNDNHKRRLNLKECLRYSIKSWFNYLTLYIILLLFIWVATILVNSPVIGLMTDYLDWHHLFDKRSLNDTFIGSSVNWIILTMLLPLTYYMMRNAYLAIRTKEEAIDLNKKLEKFGLGNSMFEG